MNCNSSSLCSPQQLSLHYAIQTQHSQKKSIKLFFFFKKKQQNEVSSYAISLFLLRLRFYLMQESWPFWIHETHTSYLLPQERKRILFWRWAYQMIGDFCSHKEKELGTVRDPLPALRIRKAHTENVSWFLKIRTDIETSKGICQILTKHLFCSTLFWPW